MGSRTPYSFLRTGTHPGPISLGTEIQSITPPEKLRASSGPSIGWPWPHCDPFFRSGTQLATQNHSIRHPGDALARLITERRRRRLGSIKRTSCNCTPFFPPRPSPSNPRCHLVAVVPLSTPGPYVPSIPGQTTGFCQRAEGSGRTTRQLETARSRRPGNQGLCFRLGRDRPDSSSSIQFISETWK